MNFFHHDHRNIQSIASAKVNNFCNHSIVMLQGRTKKITIQRQHKKYPPSINVLFLFRRRRDDDVKGQEGKKSILLSRNINQRRRRPAASFFSPVFP